MLALHRVPFTHKNLARLRVSDDLGVPGQAEPADPEAAALKLIERLPADLLGHDLVEQAAGRPRDGPVHARDA
jgi:hypothetical protein